jgi:hypothetical protein
MTTHFVSLLQFFLCCHFHVIFFYLDSIFIFCEFTFLRVQMQDILVYNKLS